jgi:hypothetical protein
MPNTSSAVIPEWFYRESLSERINSEIPAQKICGNDIRTYLLILVPYQLIGDLENINLKLTQSLTAQ